MFIPTDELVLAELGSAMGANDGAETSILRLADVPFSDIVPVAGDDEVMVAETRDSSSILNFHYDADTDEFVYPSEVDERFRDNMAVCLSSIKQWDGTMDANL